MARSGVIVDPRRIGRHFDVVSPWARAQRLDEGAPVVGEHVIVLTRGRGEKPILLRHVELQSIQLVDEVDDLAPTMAGCLEGVDLPAICTGRDGVGGVISWSRAGPVWQQCGD